MEVRLIDSFDAFLRLQQPWNELSRQTPDDHAFMRHEWFEHWLSSHERESQLHMITGWQDGQLVGVLPLVWKDVELRGMRFRALRFAESPVSPRCNALLLRAESLEPLTGQLASAKTCQLIELQHLEANSPTTRLLVDSLRHQTSLLVHISPGRQSPYLTLDCTWDDYLKGLTSRRRYWIKNSCVKRLSNSGYEYDIRFITEESEADYLVQFMTHVSDHSWKAEVGTAIGQVPTQQRMYAEFTRVGLASGLVEAAVLTIDGKAAAFDYYLKSGRRYSGIRCDYNSSFGQYRPGENLRIAFIRRLGESAVSAEIDFGGVVAEHKLQWANHIRNHIVVHCAAPWSKGASVVLWKKLKGALPSKGEAMATPGTSDNQSGDDVGET